MEWRKHPVEYLFGKLKDLKYPDGLVAVPERIRGTAFFPGGHGLWRETRGGSLPHLPCGKVMVLGNNFDSECRYRKSLRAGDELSTPTWRHLLTLLQSPGVNIRPEDCFFTNAYMGLLTGCSTNTGESPGAKDPEFKRRCRSLLAEQIAVQRPRLILALGRFVPEFLAALSPDLAEWRKWPGFQALDASGPLKRVNFADTGEQATTVVVLMHPSAWNRQCRRYRGKVGHDAELTMLREAMVTLRQGGGA